MLILTKSNNDPPIGHYHHTTDLTTVVDSGFLFYSIKKGILI